MWMMDKSRVIEEMDVLMEAINNHYGNNYSSAGYICLRLMHVAWLGSDERQNLLNVGGRCKISSNFQRGQNAATIVQDKYQCY